MSAPDFLDSNILIYAYDPKDSRRQEIARELLKRAIAGDGVVSIQVLAELAVTLLHRLTPRVAPEAVKEILDLISPISVISPDAETVRRAVQPHEEYGVHFFDGMLIATAKRVGCKRIWSEDLNAGQSYFGVAIENPFA